MSTVDEIKAAAAKLNPDQQVELFRWWVESDAFKQRQLAALKREVWKGIDHLDNGRRETCDNSDVMRLAEDIGRSGQRAPQGLRQKPEDMNPVFSLRHSQGGSGRNTGFTSRKTTPAAADEFILAILTRFSHLAAMPGMGRQRERIDPGLRSFPVGNHVIFYRPLENGVEIARVLHGAPGFSTAV